MHCLHRSPWAWTENTDAVLLKACSAACRDLAHWFRNQTFFSEDVNGTAEPHLGAERLDNYVNDLTSYVNMLRAGFPDAALLAVHTMPQQNPRQAEPPGPDPRPDASFREP